MTTAEPGYVPPHVDDDLDTEVLPIRRRPGLSVLTAVLALAVVAAGAFVGGVEVQKRSGGSFGSSSSSAGAAGSGRAALASGGGGARFGGRARGGGFAGGGGAGGFSFGGGAGGSATVGLVTLIKGRTLYVTDFTGNTVKVTAPPGVRVSKTVATSIGGIHPGDSVVVRGTKQKNGTTKASSVTIGGSAAG
jgi:uncharacterized membrane protein